MLLSEGGELAQLQLFGFKVEAMSKSTFYFILFVLVAVDVVQSGYRKKTFDAKSLRDAEIGFQPMASEIFG